MNQHWTNRVLTRRGIAVAALAMALLVCVGDAGAQDGGDKIAALKQSLQTGKAALAKYEWVETTTLRLDGEQKSSTQNQCYYGAEGNLQKTPLGAPAEEKKSPRGLRGRVAKKKKGEMTDYMAAVQSLIKHYVPPDPERLQKVKDAGKVSVNLLGQDRQQIEFHNYVKEGDVLAVTLNPATNELLGMSVASYLEKADDAVTLDVKMTTLPDGALFASEILLDGKSKKIKVDIENTGHRLLNP